MNLNINNEENINIISKFISDIIKSKLNSHKRVLLFLSGGSAIKLEIETLKSIKEVVGGKLIVTLADERFGPVGHKDSNWFQLENEGLKDIKKVTMIPFLGYGDDNLTENKLNIIIENELKQADYKIGIFGMGEDGHIAGILPHSEAVYSDKMICFYKANIYNRITVTPKIFKILDEVVVYVMGDKKWKALENLYKEIPIDDQPAQVLKEVKLSTIFTNYKNQKI